MRSTLAFVTAALVTLTVAVPASPFPLLPLLSPLLLPPLGFLGFLLRSLLCLAQNLVLSTAVLVVSSHCAAPAVLLFQTVALLVVYVASFTTLPKAANPRVKPSAVRTTPTSVSKLHVLLPPVLNLTSFSFATTIEITFYPSFEFVVDSRGNCT
ncbi:hypothetical protein BDP27DRAFT_1362595 [Rhodocollybia butyracea]|uniref:Uncharacterized protein n=1 Tax=Rhodocollybia butyracea TaxID=206335 RepID=A0A9P5PWR5_9AGAR|nr:hypothetical protein BDP27DRAFT_1362595 [Rhodocollybia butyracea]